MKYKIALTEPIELNGKQQYGVTVTDEKGTLIYTERFHEELHATLHIERLSKLIEAIAASV